MICIRDPDSLQAYMIGEPAILGWDIGGVNLKAARLAPPPGAASLQSLCHPFEIQHSLGSLASTLTSLARQLEGEASDRHAVTMTAELSQAFRTKREGISFVLDAFEAGFPSRSLHVYTVEGGFVSPREARLRPLSVAASNWAATARWTAQRFPTVILIDVGSTTTDVIPIVGGEVVSVGHTDPQRLQSGELVYTGALRTPVEAIVRQVPLWGGGAGVSTEGFALIGDVHLWLGRLQADDYSCRTPDGRPATREHAAERIARVVCADREMLGDEDIELIALEIANAQITTIVSALERVRRRQPSISTAAVTGVGGFIATEAARAAGLSVVSLAGELGVGSQSAPAAAVASLLQRWLARERGP
jgi:(4-(4-[2-(gamma-L-glutamylamino)ethyl]phenoxymethyl)furan-2-yl)methanamine synthase